MLSIDDRYKARYRLLTLLHPFVAKFVIKNRVNMDKMKEWSDI